MQVKDDKDISAGEAAFINTSKCGVRSSETRKSSLWFRVRNFISARSAASLTAGNLDRAF